MFSFKAVRTQELGGAPSSEHMAAGVGDLGHGVDRLPGVAIVVPVDIALVFKKVWTSGFRTGHCGGVGIKNRHGVEAFDLLKQLLNCSADFLGRQIGSDGIRFIDKIGAGSRASPVSRGAVALRQASKKRNIKVARCWSTGS